MEATAAVPKGRRDYVVLDEQDLAAMVQEILERKAPAVLDAFGDEIYEALADEDVYRKVNGDDPVSARNADHAHVQGARLLQPAEERQATLIVIPTRNWQSKTGRVRPTTDVDFD